MQGGLSWRVGVTAPVDEQELRALGPMREAVLAKRTAAAIMEIEVSLDTDALQAEDPAAEPPDAADAAVAAAFGSHADSSSKSGGGVPGVATPSLHASRNPTSTGMSLGTRPGSSLSVVPPTPSMRQGGSIYNGMPGGVGGCVAGMSASGGSDIMARLSAAGIQPTRRRASMLSQVDGWGPGDTGSGADAAAAAAEQAADGRPSAGAGGARGGPSRPRAPAGAKGRARRSSWIAVEGPGGAFRACGSIGRSSSGRWIRRGLTSNL